MSLMSSQYQLDSSQYTQSTQFETKQKQIFGTQVSLSETADRFRDFLLKNDFPISSDIQLTIDGRSFAKDLLKLLLNYPTDVIPIFEHTLADFALEKSPNLKLNSINLSFINCGYKLDRVFDPFLVDKIVTFRGVVVRQSGVVPMLSFEVYSCLLCKVDLKVCSDAVADSSFDAEYVRALSVLEQENLTANARPENNDRFHSLNNLDTQFGSNNTDTQYTQTQSPHNHPNNQPTLNNQFANNPSGDILIHAATTPHFSYTPTLPKPLLSTISKDTCPNCLSKHSLTLNTYRSTFVDTQVVRLQELPQDVPFSSSPFTFDLNLREGLCNTLSPGMRVNIVGVFRLLKRLTRDRRMVKAGFRGVVDVLSVVGFGFDDFGHKSTFSDLEGPNENEHLKNLPYIDVLDANLITHAVPSDSGRDSPGDPSAPNNGLNNLGVNNSQIDPTFSVPVPLQTKISDYDFLLKISKLPKLLLRQILTNSIAPQIHSHTLAKQSILLQLSGGCSKQKARSNIHVLLIGDPGIAKSQLLKFVSSVTNGMYACGSGASAVGLTASVVRNSGNNFVLEPGALVLSSNRTCCIDEFDKLGDSVKTSLLEAMEQQTISVAKGGIVATLQAKTSVLASCNPKKSCYDFSMSVVDNINLPCALLSRFDVVCVMIDFRDPLMDSDIGEHILSMYCQDSPNKSESGSDDLKLVNSDGITRADFSSSNKNEGGDTTPSASGVRNGQRGSDIPATSINEAAHGTLPASGLRNDPKGPPKSLESDEIVLTEGITSSTLADNIQADSPHNDAYHSNTYSNSAEYLNLNGEPNNHNSSVNTTIPLNSNDKLVLTKENIQNAHKNNHLDLKTFNQYIKLIKNHRPRLTPAAKTTLKIKYNQMRQLNNGKTITATTRQLESMIRLSEAYAKLEMTNVTAEHVESAYQLLKEAMMGYAIDPKTGIIDMDIINTGKSAHQRSEFQDIMGSIQQKITESGIVSMVEVRSIAKEYWQEVVGTFESMGEYVVTETHITRAE